MKVRKISRKELSVSTKGQCNARQREDKHPRKRRHKAKVEAEQGGRKVKARRGTRLGMKRKQGMDKRRNGH